MSWAVGFDDNLKRFIGYGVPAVCEQPECNAKIDRGLSYLCGGLGIGEYGCGRCFCGKHLYFHSFRDGHDGMVCKRCDTYRKPYPPKPDTKEWKQHQATDESWAEWRAEQAELAAPPAEEIEPK